MKHPIKSDSRYTVNLEFCGHVKPHWVVRFCGDWVGSSEFYASAVVKAVGHNAARMGALIVTEIRT